MAHRGRAYVTDVRWRTYVIPFSLLILALSACVRVRSQPATGESVVEPDEAKGFSTLVTDVRFVQISTSLDEIPVYGVPSGTQAKIGVVYGGDGAHVIGISADGQWWRVLCGEDVIGDSCWISADPNLTQPSVSPGVLTDASGTGSKT